MEKNTSGARKGIRIMRRALSTFKKKKKGLSALYSIITLAGSFAEKRISAPRPTREEDGTQQRDPKERMQNTTQRQEKKKKNTQDSVEAKESIRFRSRVRFLPLFRMPTRMLT